MDSQNTSSLNRDHIIVRTSILGIVANAFLSLFKVMVGLTSNSIAIVLDAVNNMSDAASSMITIVGTKLAGKEPDKKHPFGYGRIEYISAMIISMLVLYAGITSFVESVKKILHPDVPDYRLSSLIIVMVAVLVKIFLGIYVKRTGKAVRSDSLENSGNDAILDSVISASTLAAAVIYIFSGISLEAWLGAVIALVIIKAGFDMLTDIVSKILGEGVEAQLVRSIKQTIASFPEVNGVYDMVLHNYGPDTYNGSVHIEVPDTLSAVDLDKLQRKIQMKVYSEHRVILSALGVYSYNTKDSEADAARDQVLHIVAEEPYVRQMHGFYIDHTDKTIRFDIVVSFDAQDRKAVYKRVEEKTQQAFPGYQVQVAMDMDYNELN